MNKHTTDFALSTTQRGFSTAEFSRMMASGAFDDMWVELIDGKLERMPPPGNAHGGRQADILISLAALIVKTRLRGEIGIEIDGSTVLACDVAILTRAVEGNALVSPDDLALVVEIAETTRDRDLGMKRRLYAGAGIPTYWVVDGDRSVVHVYDRPEDGDYKGAAIVRFGEPLAVPGTEATIVLD